MLQLFAQRTYRYLFGAQVVSLLGTGLATVALGLLAYDLAGTKTSVVLGMLFAIKMVAYVFIAPVATAALIRVPRTKVLVGADVLRVGVALALPFATAVWQVAVLILLLQIGSATFSPTFQAVIPLVVPEEEDYTQALSLSRLAYDVESIASPLVAALLLTIMPANALFLGTAFGFAGSAFLVLGAALPKALRHPEERPLPTMPFSQRARVGVQAFMTRPALRPLLALDVSVAASGALVIVYTVVIAQSHFGLDETAVALLLGCNGAGSMVMALALPRWLHRVGERRVMLAGAYLVTVTTLGAGMLFASGLSSSGLGASASGAQPGVWALGVLWFMHGLGWSAIQTPIGRILSRSARRDELPEIFAARFSLSHAAWLWAYPLAGTLGAFGLVPTAFILAALSAVGAVLATLLWAPALVYPVGQGTDSEEWVEYTPNASELDYAANILRLLADRTRLAILAMLDNGELTVTAIAERLDRPVPAVSQHLAKLRAAGLVQVRKAGTMSYYSQPDAHLHQLVTHALHFSEHHFNPNPLHHRVQQ